MTKLNQLIAVESGVKTKAERVLTDLYHKLQKPALLSGIARTYRPKDDDGDTLPSESTLVQVKVEEVLSEAAEGLKRLFDVTFAKETGNSVASADVVVNGKTLLAKVPVTYLLFLEKQLVNLQTFVGKLPTLDPASVWTFDQNSNQWRSDPVETVRTKKVPFNWVKAPADEHHAAQVEVLHEDVKVGTWTKVDFSGALSATRKAELLNRVEELMRAVKFAREEANSIEVTNKEIGSTVFNYLFS